MDVLKNIHFFLVFVELKIYKTNKTKQNDCG